MTPPPEIYVRDTNRNIIGVITSYEELTYNRIFNDVGVWTLRTKDAETADLLTPPTNAEGRRTGMRGVVLRRGDATFASGWVIPSSTTNDGNVTEWFFRGFDDTVYLSDALYWPNPAQPDSQQTDAYHTLGGPASTRIRAYAIANIVNRQQIPGFATGNDLRLGPNRRSRARFRNGLELSQAIAHRDLNFQVRQRDSDRALFLYQWLPVDKRLSVQFSPESGTVHGWSHEFTEATATHVVVGAGGEDEDRGFREFSGHVSADELLGVRKIEHFQDRRDLSLTDDDGNPSDAWIDEAREDASEFLAEATSRAKFAITIAGQPAYEYGVDYVVGDLVRAYRGQDQDSQPIGLVDDLIDEVMVTWSAEGERAEIHVGAPDFESTNRPMEWALRRLEKRIRDLETKR